MLHLIHLYFYTTIKFSKFLTLLCVEKDFPNVTKQGVHHVMV
jgi:hypothetical protein